MSEGFFTDVASCIIAAWGLGLIARWLRQPPLLAYLLAGVVLGPVGSTWIEDSHSVEAVAEIGLVLLLFMIGLEIDLKRMLKAGRVISLTAAAQILGGALLGAVLFRFLPLPGNTGNLSALYLAVVTVLSSTVIVVKALYDKRELDTLSGRLTVGVLVLQDLFAILFLAVQPNLTSPSVTQVALSLFKVVELMGVAYVASRFVLPALFRSVAKLPELVLVGSLAWCFLLASLAYLLGLSFEMGALIAGVGVSTFPYTLDVVAKVTSLRDFFVTLFFVALGATIPAPTGTALGGALVLCLVVWVTRFITVFIPLHGLGQGHRASLVPVINLSQISELSLVILALGAKRGHVGPELMAMASYAFVLLAITSTYTILSSHNLVRRLSPWLSRLGFAEVRDTPDASEAQRPHPRIFFLGFFTVASSLLEDLRRTRPQLVAECAVVDFNPEAHRRLLEMGLQAHYGDITSRDTLLHAGIAHARLILCTLPDGVLRGGSVITLTRQVRELNPEAQIVVLSDSLASVDALYAAGASYVSLPRLTEAARLVEVVSAALEDRLDALRGPQTCQLQDRREIIA
ncbi:MAG TPA: cation:proton antiporter [Verrucomicrobiota bacterium]|nr:cation:proton antiporter [Verrucomicrobiota bacterium]HNU52656.1 cation:proton antiporter [Verrucomicrobiota bacterium]